MNRFSRKWVGLLAIVAVVFAQLSVSAYACPLPFAGLDEAASVVNAPEQNSSGRDAESPALCQKHCVSDQQNVKDSPQPLAGISLAPAFVVALSMDRPLTLPAIVPAPSLARVTSPPHSIRNCCFRI